MLGRKTGGGFYKYEGKGQTPNEKLALWITSHSERSEVKQSAVEESRDIVHRLIFLMVNEAARCVEEGVVDSPADADYGMILGTGFAPFRGGPLRFAEHFGLKKLVENLERLARTEEKFIPCEILKKHARDGTKFYED
jgi:3-hydroxyacyl-CoA dehydrogenase/enoyl-CoA hydratase/3-hydroxybutyryl-CoA epimerase